MHQTTIDFRLVRGNCPGNINFTHILKNRYILVSYKLEITEIYTNEFSTQSLGGIKKTIDFVIFVGLFLKRGAF